MCTAPPHGTGPHELRFYPRYHLDDASLLCRHPLRSAPLALDTQVSSFLVNSKVGFVKSKAKFPYC